MGAKERCIELVAHLRLPRLAAYQPGTLQAPDHCLIIAAAMAQHLMHTLHQFDLAVQAKQVVAQVITKWPVLSRRRGK